MQFCSACNNRVSQQWGGICLESCPFTSQSVLTVSVLYCLSLLLFCLVCMWHASHVCLVFSFSSPFLLLLLLFVLDEKASPGAPEDDGKLSVGLVWLTLCRLLLCLSLFFFVCVRVWMLFVRFFCRTVNKIHALLFLTLSIILCRVATSVFWSPFSYGRKTTANIERALQFLKAFKQQVKKTNKTRIAEGDS